MSLEATRQVFLQRLVESTRYDPLALLTGQPFQRLPPLLQRWNIHRNPILSHLADSNAFQRDWPMIRENRFRHVGCRHVAWLFRSHLKIEPHSSYGTIRRFEAVIVATKHE